MSKKAQFELASKSLFWMIAAFIITLVVLFFAFALSSYKGKLTIVPPQLQAELVSLRFTSNADCFAFQDSVTGRVYSGIIDLNKFNDKQLRKCYLTPDKEGIKTFNFRLKLESDGTELSTNNYFNHDDFTLFKEVLVRKDNSLVKDQLIIYVQEYIR